MKKNQQTNHHRKHTGQTSQASRKDQTSTDQHQTQEIAQNAIYRTEPNITQIDNYRNNIGDNQQQGSGHRQQAGQQQHEQGQDGQEQGQGREEEQGRESDVEEQEPRERRRKKNRRKPEEPKK